jgi:hypothetical protein
MAPSSQELEPPLNPGRFKAIMYGQRAGRFSILMLASLTFALVTLLVLLQTGQRQLFVIAAVMGAFAFFASVAAIVCLSKVEILDEAIQRHQRNRVLLS